MDAGDGSRHRRRFAVVYLGLTGAKTVGIEGKICGFLAKCSSSPISKFPETRANFPFFLAGSCSSSSELSISLFNCNLFPFSVKISADYGENRENSRFWGSGQAGIASSPWRFSPLDALVRAGMDAGDGSRHRRPFAVISADYGENRENSRFWGSGPAGIASSP
ncbi:hypothetical protein CRG98_029281 [Punica granatum]|uniref:Uncharacterized protein n=1 Tax=Punica granatum TaxID=22663 RepID=A0A2I0J260_PUNGR|nr:hypothetical protein CRG98_029281 [Punica granatum]